MSPPRLSTFLAAIVAGPAPLATLPPRVVFRRRIAALAALVGISLASLPAFGRELLVYRPLFGDAAGRPTVRLAPGREVEVRDQRLRVEGARKLRVESPDPETVVVMQIKPKQRREATLVLTVILLSRKERFDFQYGRESQALAGGSLITHRNFRVGEGQQSELAGDPGEVVEIRLQDDAGAELRLRQQGSELILRVIPPWEGGTPSGGALPYYFGERLTFLDYDLLAVGGTDNFFGEWVLFEHFVLMANALQTDALTAVLTRGVVRAELARWRRFAVTLEGGAAFYILDPEDPEEENAGQPTWVLGATTHYRIGNWGAAVHAATVSGATLTTALGGWQFSSSFGAVLEWQSFQGLSGFGAGLSWLF